MTQREVALGYVDRFLNVAYRWGGDDPMAGLDCSGLMVLTLQAVGVLPTPGDWSAEALRKRFKPVQAPVPGCLVFRMAADGAKAVHVGMVRFVLDDGTVLVVEAGGGDSQTTSTDAAIQQNAFVKLRPVWAAAVYADPFIAAQPGDV